jgi:hypothetical protein
MRGHAKLCCCNDVLEHLVDPGATLRQLRRKLSLAVSSLAPSRTSASYHR